MSTHNGTALRPERKVRGLTQAQMGERLGVSLRTYIRYEQDGAPKPIAMLVNLVLKRIKPRVAPKFPTTYLNQRASQKAPPAPMARKLSDRIALMKEHFETHRYEGEPMPVAHAPTSPIPQAAFSQCDRP